MHQIKILCDFAGILNHGVFEDISFGRFYSYLFLKNLEISFHLVFSFLEMAKCENRFLFLLTDREIKKEVSEENFCAICSNTKFVMMSAYDGEGCIFWERA